LMPEKERERPIVSIAIPMTVSVSACQ
jgi:hypothetical protein